jgi:hypothetical protein
VVVFSFVFVASQGPHLLSKTYCFCLLPLARSRIYLVANCITSWLLSLSPARTERDPRTIEDLGSILAERQSLVLGQEALRFGDRGEAGSTGIAILHHVFVDFLALNVAPKFLLGTRCSEDRTAGSSSYGSRTNCHDESEHLYAIGRENTERTQG